MSMVEGIGDEVIQFFTIIIIVFLGLLAWWSTNISEGPLIRTVLILERRSRSRTSNDNSNTQPAITSNENSIDTGQVDPASIQELVENDNSDHLNGNDSDKEENESSSSLLLSNGQAPSIQLSGSGEMPQSNMEQPIHQENNEINENNVASLQSQTSVDSDDSTVLRKRRLAFFQSRGPTLLEPSVSSETTTDNQTTAASSLQDEESSTSANHDHIRIRLKYLNDDQIVVEGRLQEQLGDFKRRHFRIELAAEKMVRLIFNGQVLQSDSQTLQGYGLFDNCVVHCLVHNQRTNTPRTAQTQTSGSSIQSMPPDWNLGTLLYTCLSIILGFAWYFRYQYSHFFTVTTTAALFGLTGMFAITLLSIYLPDNENIQ